MRDPKKIISTILVIVMMGWLLPELTWTFSCVWAGEATITEHPIESTATPDEVLATESGKESNMLIWSMIGVALVGGIAALAGSGGSDGGGGGDDGDGDNSPTTGTIPVQW